jgi:hypothetical protein
MAVTISNVYVQTFEQNVRHLAQQSTSKLRDKVTVKSTEGEKHNWERLGLASASLKSGTRVATPTSDLPWSRRVSLAATYHVGETSEQEDPVQMLVDPNSNITRSLAMAMKRQMDDVIIAAATGDATDGAGSPVSFPAAQTVGTGAEVISLDIVTEVNELFQANDIDPDIPKCMVVGPTQIRKLLQTTEVNSSDYNTLKVLAGNGMVDNWMGFNWIMSNRLLNPGAGEISCLAFTEQALGLQINRDISVRVSEDPSISFAWRLYCFMTLGAVRVEDEHIVHLHLKDALV